MHIVIHAFKERMHVYCQVYSLKEVCLQIRKGSVPLKIREQWNVHTYVSCNQCKMCLTSAIYLGSRGSIAMWPVISISARMIHYVRMLICYAHVL